MAEQEKVVEETAVMDITEVDPASMRKDDMATLCRTLQDALKGARGIEQKVGAMVREAIDSKMGNELGEMISTIFDSGWRAIDESVEQNVGRMHKELVDRYENTFGRYHFIGNADKKVNEIAAEVIKKVIDREQIAEKITVKDQRSVIKALAEELGKVLAWSKVSADNGDLLAKVDNAFALATPDLQAQGLLSIFGEQRIGQFVGLISMMTGLQQPQLPKKRVRRMVIEMAVSLAAKKDHIFNSILRELSGDDGWSEINRRASAIMSGNPDPGPGGEPEVVGGDEQVRPLADLLKATLGIHRCDDDECDEDDKDEETDEEEEDSDDECDKKETVAEKQQRLLSVITKVQDGFERAKRRKAREEALDEGTIILRPDDTVGELFANLRNFMG